MPGGYRPDAHKVLATGAVEGDYEGCLIAGNRFFRRELRFPNIMISTTSLTGLNLRTYERIFQHPISHNLEWRDVHALLGKLGEAVEEHNGNLKVTRNGEVLVLHPARTKDVAEMEEVMSLRHFLERSEKPKEA